MIKAVIFDCDGTILNPQGGVPYPGIPELLQRLEENEFDLYVWTGRDGPSLSLFLQKFGLSKYFKDTRTAGECLPKPHPEGLRQMLGEMEPSQCVVIGDSWADMKGAKNFGAHGIGAVWSSHAQEETLKEFGAQVLATRPMDCHDLILSLGIMT